MVEKSSKTKAQIARESEQIKKQFGDIKQKQETGHYSDSFYEGPVLIKEQVTDQLREYLNMGQDINELRALNLAQHLPQEYPYRKALAMTEDYLSFLSRDDDTKGTKGFVHQLGSRFEEEYPIKLYSQYQDVHNAAAIGAVLVLKAFEMQLGESFFDNLRRTSPREVLDAFNQGNQLATNRSLVEKARSRIKMPDEGQIFLKPFISEFANVHSGIFAPYVEYGATLAFSAIDKLWPKLKPDFPQKPADTQKK